MKVSKNKIISVIIGGVIIAGAGGYALADQASRPSVAATSSAMTSSIVSQVSSASETEVSSKMDESSTATHVATKAPASEPAKTVTSAPTSSASTTEENSMKPNTLYFAVVNPDTGKLVWPRDPGYWDIRNKLGGDAGTIDPAHSTACQKAREEFKAKQATAPAK